MTGDVLVVDDEADIRDLVADILRDEGYSVRTAAEFGPGDVGDRGAQTVAGDPRHLDEGRRPRWARTARARQRSRRRPAGDHDFRPRHHRNGGVLDQARRLRLPGKAVQVRPAAAAGGAGHRGFPPAPRGHPPSPARHGARQPDRRVARRPAAAHDDRPPGGGQQSGADRRAARLGQGNRRPTDPRGEPSGRGPVRRHLRRRHDARASRRRAVRRGRGGGSAAPHRRLRTRPWRHPLHRRRRDHATR